MAINSFEVNTSNLGREKSNMQTKLAESKREMQRMFQEIKELDGMWDGVANNAFNKQFQADYNTMDEMCQIVERLTQCMEYAIKEYEACERIVGSKVNSIQV